MKKDSIGGVVVIPFILNRNFAEIACVQDSSQTKPLWKFPAGAVHQGQTFDQAAWEKVRDEAGRTTMTYNFPDLIFHEVDVSHLESKNGFGLPRVFYTTLPIHLVSVNTQFLSPKGYAVRIFPTSTILNKQNSFLNHHRGFLKAALDSFG